MKEYPGVVIKRERRRSFALSRQADTFLLKVPLLAGGWEIRAFLKKNEGWMQRRLAEEEQLKNYRQQQGVLTKEEIKTLKKKADLLIRERLAYYGPLAGVSWNRVSIRAQKARWGSCSSKGNLNFNCLLALAPPKVLDSVVVHELCHLKEMNHSPRFYAEVLRLMPDYKIHQKWLKEEGRRLLSRLK